MGPQRPVCDCLSPVPHAHAIFGGSAEIGCLLTSRSHRSPVFAPSKPSAPAALPGSLPQAAALAVSPGSLQSPGYTTCTVICALMRQAGTTAEGRTQKEVAGHKKPSPKMPTPERPHAPSPCLSTAPAGASYEPVPCLALGLAWHRQQGTKPWVLPPWRPQPWRQN